VEKKLSPVAGLKAWAEQAYPLLKIERSAAKPPNGDTAAA
jgi:hypothetical protein